MAEWEGLGARILSRVLEHERVRQQLLGLDVEVANHRFADEFACILLLRIASVTPTSSSTCVFL